VVVGALSAFLVFNYVNSADDRAQGNAKRVDVFVVKKDIPRGLSGAEAEQQGYIKSAQITSEFKPATAINDISIIQSKVAIAPLATGQVLVDGMFADPIESQITFSGRVPDSCVVDAAGNTHPCVAITMSFDQTHGVAGVIVPGDFVNILISPNASPECAAEVAAAAAAGATAVPTGSGTALNTRAYPEVGTSAGQQDRGVTFCDPARYLYQAVQVLFVDKTAVPLPGEQTAAGAAATTSGGLITFAVPPEAAQMLASVDSSKLTLTLLPTNYKPVALGPLSAFPPLLPGEDSTQLTPYGPNGIQKK
jgi:Flp pilus assembly protein CpaB